MRVSGVDLIEDATHGEHEKVHVLTAQRGGDAADLLEDELVDIDVFVAGTLGDVVDVLGHPSDEVLEALDVIGERCPIDVFYVGGDAEPFQQGNPNVLDLFLGILVEEAVELEELRVNSVGAIFAEDDVQAAALVVLAAVNGHELGELLQRGGVEPRIEMQSGNFMSVQSFRELFDEGVPRADFHITAAQESRRNLERKATAVEQGYERSVRAFHRGTDNRRTGRV